MGQALAERGSYLDYQKHQYTNQNHSQSEGKCVTGLKNSSLAIPVRTPGSNKKIMTTSPRNTLLHFYVSISGSKLSGKNFMDGILWYFIK